MLSFLTIFGMQVSVYKIKQKNVFIQQYKRKLFSIFHSNHSLIGKNCFFVSLKNAFELFLVKFSTIVELTFLVMTEFYSKIAK